VWVWPGGRPLRYDGSSRTIGAAGMACCRSPWVGLFADDAYISRRAPQAPGADFSVRLRRVRGCPEGIQRRAGSCAPIGQLPTKGPSFRAGEQPQRRLLAAHETGIPSHLDVLEYQKKSRRIVVGQLLCGVGWRSAYVNSAPVHTILRQYIEEQNRPPAGAL
jgi:hypothetical protein